MALNLPPLPKTLRATDADGAAELARRVEEWTSAGQNLLKALRAAAAVADVRLTDLENAPASSGGGTPDAHATSHEDGGTDEIDVTGLSGLLGDAQTPLDHASSHENGGGDELDLTGLSGLLADAQNPLAHKTSHQSGGSDAIKLDDLAAPDDNTDLDATTSAHGLLPKVSSSGTKVLTNNGGSGPAWQTPDEAVLTKHIFHPDAEPSSADSHDDECGGSSIDGKWGTWDVAGYLTWTANASKKRYKVSGTGNGGVRCGGLYQAVPAGGVAYSIACKVSMAIDTSSGFGGGCIIGLFVSEDVATNPSTADFRRMTIQAGSAATAPIQTVLDARTAYNSAAVGGTSVAADLFSPYMRIRMNGSTGFAADRSADGQTWTPFATATLGFTPTHMGVIFNVSGSGVVGLAYLHWFRCVSGAGANAIEGLVPGDQIRVGAYS